MSTVPLQKNEHFESDELMFQSIYDTYYTELCLFAKRFVYSDEESEEIVQGVIVRLWTQREKILQIQSVRSYLYTSVRNHCLNYIKHQKYVDAYRDSARHELKEIESEGADEFLNFEVKEKIEVAINDLPERCREVFEMSRFDGLKYREIADQLGITVKAVEANISRALSSLRKSLREYLLVDLIVISIIFCSHGIGDILFLLS